MSGLASHKVPSAEAKCWAPTISACVAAQSAGLERLVEYNRKKQEEVHLQELKAALSESIIADPPLPVAESIRIVQDSKKEWQLPDTETIKVPPRCVLC